MKNINNAFRSHLEVRSQFPVRDVATTMQQKRARCLQSRRSKARRNYYYQRCYWFQPATRYLSSSKPCSVPKSLVISQVSILSERTTMSSWNMRRDQASILSWRKQHKAKISRSSMTWWKDSIRYSNGTSITGPCEKNMQAFMNFWKHRKLNLKVRYVALIQITSPSSSGTSWCNP